MQLQPSIFHSPPDSIHEDNVLHMSMCDLRLTIIYSMVGMVHIARN